MSNLALTNITKRYPNGFLAADHISLSVKDGEFISLLGPSGCGKSTTLRMIAGLEDATSGDICINDIRVNDMPSKDRGIAMVFQSYALFPHMTVEANIGFGLKIRKMDEKSKRQKIDWALGLLDLRGFEKSKPGELSGGQRQRVALGRALVLEPDVLLLDEPLSNLDAKLRIRMRTEIKRIHKKLKTTIIYVTHDQEEAMTLSDRIVIMNHGKIIQTGTPSEIYKKPANRFVAGFIGSPPFNFIDGQLEKRGAAYWFRYGKNELLVPDYLKEKIEKEIEGSQVSLALRPEDGEFHNAPGDSCLNGITSVRETMGSEDIVTVEVENTLVSLRVGPGDPVEMDAPVYIQPKPGKLYIFNAHED
jgi:multiple sugar transport system ATP-binding protein